MSASELPSPRFAPASVDASHQIALEIRRYLEREGLQPGDRIGTEQELATEFGVSRPTLREGLRLLASSHLIRVGRGRAGGIFVARTPGVVAVGARLELPRRFSLVIPDVEQLHRGGA